MPSTFPGAIDNFTDPLANSSLASPSHAGQHSDLNDAVEKVEQYMGLVKVIPTAVTNGTINATTGTVTVGNAVSSVSVTCFSSLYENYRIIYTGGVSSADCAIGFQLGASTTGYYAGLARIDSTAAASFLADSNTTQWRYAGMGTTDAATVTIEVFEPSNAKFTRSMLSWLDTRTNNAWGQGTGVHRVATAYTAFTLIPSVGTLTGGSIRVYGYRN